MAQLQDALVALPPLEDGYEETCTFSKFANWMLPGWVMLGRYPYVDPSYCTNAIQGEVWLMRILREGITTFVCLQEELPEQAAMPPTGVGAFLPYWQKATELAAASWPERRLTFLHLPIVDIQTPEQDSLALLLDDLMARLQRGERLYIHCWGGCGRAGTVGACLLSLLCHISADEALQRVNSAFSTRGPMGTFGSPETAAQCQFVRDFVAAQQPPPTSNNPTAPASPRAPSHP